MALDRRWYRTPTSIWLPNSSTTGSRSSRMGTGPPCLLKLGFIRTSLNTENQLQETVRVTAVPRVAPRARALTTPAVILPPYPDVQLVRMGYDRRFSCEQSHALQVLEVPMPQSDRHCRPVTVRPGAIKQRAASFARRSPIHGHRRAGRPNGTAGRHPSPRSSRTLPSREW